jgi:hypothetical protein
MLTIGAPTSAQLKRVKCILLSRIIARANTFISRAENKICLLIAHARFATIVN